MSSFRRTPESSLFNRLWTPAFAGVTGFGTFYEIIKDLSGSFSYQVTLFTGDSLTTKEWNQVRDRVQTELENFEYEKFETKGRLFYYPDDKAREESRKKAEAQQLDRMIKWDVAKKIRQNYKELMVEMAEMIERDASVTDFSKRFGLTEENIKL